MGEGSEKSISSHSHQKGFVAYLRKNLVPTNFGKDGSS